MGILLIRQPGGCGDAIEEALLHHKYRVQALEHGEDAGAHLSAGSYDCVLMDAQTPGLSALELLKQARQNGVAVPVLLLSDQGRLEDRVAGLDAGADDYLCKPFAMTELLARLRALLRRSSAYHCDILQLGGLALDCTSFELSSQAGCLRLNKKEYLLLACFMRNPNRVFSVEELMERVWGWDSRARIHVVWTNVTCLRRKLERLRAPLRIESLRGAGYRLVGTDRQ